MQRNLVLVNDLFKSKGSVANCVTDRASVHTGNASEQFLHHNRILILVHTVPEQLPGGHFHSKVIGMLVVFLGYKILILVFFRVFWEIFGKLKPFFPKQPENGPKNCNLGIFRRLRSKAGYFLGFS